MAKFTQPSLSGGELAPGLRGRVDLAKYPVSLGKARNFITKPTGGGAKRPGTFFRGRVKFSNKLTRLVPFIYSSSIKYLIEMGDGYFRFWVDGALLTNAQKPIQSISASNPAVVSSTAHGYANGDQVVITGVRGMTKVNSRTFTVVGVTANSYQLQGFDSSALPAYQGGGSGDRIVEVATPYDEGKLRAVRFTQSADVLYIVHGSVPQKELRRLAVNQFELRDFAFKRGPFRSFNTNEALIMAVSNTTGVVTVSTNVDTFTADMVGSLLYVEEKELRGVKPWASGEKNVPVGALRRSDSKVYRCVSRPTNLGAMGTTPYWLAGNVRPIHDSGRAFDGPQDIKDDGVNSYAVGVEWEFLHNTFGILQIQSYTDERHVQAVVIERVPDSIVGTAPAPSNTWTLSGNGVATSFALPGATSSSTQDYTVTIDGVPVQSNPYYPGGGGVGSGGGGAGPGRCVHVDSILGCGRRAGEIRIGDSIEIFDPATMKPALGLVTYSRLDHVDAVRIRTAGGASLVCSTTAPIPTEESGLVLAPALLGKRILVRGLDGVRHERVIAVDEMGVQPVQHITVNDSCFWAGENADGLVLHHNAKMVE